jgi:hypothetical protein
LHGVADDASQLAGKESEPRDSEWEADGHLLGCRHERGAANAFEPGSSGHIERLHGATTAFGTSDTTPLLTSVNDQVEYLVDYSTGDVAKLDVWGANGPDGNNVCRFRIFATLVTNS